MAQNITSSAGVGNARNQICYIRKRTLISPFVL